MVHNIITPNQQLLHTSASTSPSKLMSHNFLSSDAGYLSKSFFEYFSLVPNIQRMYHVGIFSFLKKWMRTKNNLL